MFRMTYEYVGVHGSNCGLLADTVDSSPTRYYASPTRYYASETRVTNRDKVARIRHEKILYYAQIGLQEIVCTMLFATNMNTTT